MHLAERICFWTYVALGPLAWTSCAYFLTIGRERMNKLLKSRSVLPENAPLVSILVPAKDEGSRIADCIGRVLGQDYPSFEVIAINDRSTDDTGEVLDQVAVANSSPPPLEGGGGGGDLGGLVARQLPLDSRTTKPRIRVFHIDLLPPGWLGKCHALDAGARHAEGEWLLFVDSDVVLKPNALSQLAALSIDRSYDALSILTTIETHNLAEKAMLPLLAATWSSTFAADQTNEDSQTDVALANGQVFLIRKSAYDAVGGHAAVRDRIVEDVELARLLKKQGFKMRFLSGAHLARTRMHETLGHMFNAWARIFAGTARGRIWPMVRTVLFLVCCGLTLLPAAAWAVAGGNVYWQVAVAAHAVYIAVTMGLIWRWSGNNPLYVLLLPISVFIELAILIFSIRKAISGKIDWRGMSIDLRQTSRFSAAGPSEVR